MDKFDRKIIRLLRHNARYSVSDIAREINLSRSAVTARIKRLEQDKIILGYHAQIASEDDTPKNVCAYIALTFDMRETGRQCDIFAAQIYHIEGVKWCHAISGETDMMLYVEVPSMARLNEIRDQLQTIPQLQRMLTHTVLTEFFNTTR